MRVKKILIGVVVFLLIIAAVTGVSYFNKIYSPNTGEETTIFIPTKASFSELIAMIKPHLKNSNSFEWVAKQKKYDTNIKGGKYLIKEGMNNNDLVNLLRSGQQTPVKVTFNNQDSLEKLAGRISQQIEADSLAVLTALLEPEFLKKYQFTKASILGMFIPNSYEFYWNTSAEKFRDRMREEYQNFWTPNRLEKAKKLNLSKKEVITLASIVQKETVQAQERPLVAGLYLNRLRDNWGLQADPTIIFALKQKHGQDFEVKRVLNEDLEIDSPYNTYKHTGLPPSLIAMPDISSIDAVLNPKNHNYYYMCASVSKLGYHEFATSLAQHNRNAAKYQQWVSKQGINR